MRTVKAFISETIDKLFNVFQAFTFVLFGSGTISLFSRAKIVLRIARARHKNRGRSASTFGEQLVLVGAILDISPNKLGAVAEFGCYKGLSTVAISIAAKYTRRRVFVFDSFEGLPEPKEPVRQIIGGQVIEYQKGSYNGALEEVRSTVSKYGEIEQVEFVRGFYSDTLPRRSTEEKYVLIFEDADLVESVRDVLKYAWPKLQEGCIFFCHEARDLEVAKLFFDDAYWTQLHGCKAPGLAGAGWGLPLGWGKWGSQEISVRCGSSLAVIVKNPSQ